jgi:hypothetical protein
MIRAARVSYCIAAVAVLAATGAAQALTVPAFSGTGMSSRQPEPQDAGAGDGQSFQNFKGRFGSWHHDPVPNFSGPDASIPSPGYPDFWAVNLFASLTKNSTGTIYTLTIRGSDPNVGIFNFPSGAYLLGDSEVELTAHFDSTGHLLTSMPNTYEIEGSLPGSSHPTFGSKPPGFSWQAQSVQTLFSANLTAVTVDSAHEALGFGSTGFGGWANQKQFTTGITSESVWLYSLLSELDPKSSAARMVNWKGKSGSEWAEFLSDLANHQQLETGKFFGIGSIATVPIPVALWLLGSGLAALGGFLRRHPSSAH